MRRGVWLLAVFAIIAVGLLLVPCQIPTKVYQGLGWQIRLPGEWDVKEGVAGDPASDKGLKFAVKAVDAGKLEATLQEESRKIPLVQPIKAWKKAGLTCYTYTGISIQGKELAGPRFIGVGYPTQFSQVALEDRYVPVQVAVFFDGNRSFTFSSLGGLTSSEFAAITDSFRLVPIKKTVSADQVREMSIFVPGIKTRVITARENKQIIEDFVAAFNAAQLYGQDGGKAYPVVITLNLKDGSKIEISGGAFAYQTVKFADREFNVQGADLQKIFTPQ